MRPAGVVAAGRLVGPCGEGVAHLTYGNGSRTPGKTVIEQGRVGTRHACKIRHLGHVTNRHGAHETGLEKALRVSALAKAAKPRIDKGRDVGKAIGLGIGEIEPGLSCARTLGKLSACNRSNKAFDLTGNGGRAQREVERGSYMSRADPRGVDGNQRGAPALQADKIEDRRLVGEVRQKVEQGIRCSELSHERIERTDELLA